MSGVFGKRVDATSGEGTCEVRIFDGNENVRTFLDTAIAAHRIHASARSIPWAELELEIDRAVHMPLIEEGQTVEIWFAEPAMVASRVFRGRVDHTKSFAADGRTTIAIEARGEAAALVDAGYKGELAPDVASVVTALAQHAGLSASVDFPATTLSIWINASSSYGVLRLLATSLGAVVRTPDDRVEFRCADAHRARVFSAPSTRLEPKDILSSETVQGRSIKT